MWDRAAGKGIYKDLNSIMPDIAKVINERKGEEFMFLQHLDYVDTVKAELLRALPDTDQSLFKFCTWKRHTATNEFKTIRNIIMLAPLQCPDSVYEAETKAAGLMTADSGIVPSQDLVNDVKLGEMCSDILQGFTRSAIRQSEGDTCPPCRVWMIAHPSTGLRKALPNIFPDCVVEDWQTMSFKLTKKQLAVFNAIQEKVKEGAKTFPAAPIRSRMGMQPTPFKKMLFQTAFKTALDSLKVTVQTLPAGLYFQVLT